MSELESGQEEGVGQVEVLVDQLTDQDAELVESFVTESVEVIGKAENALLALETDPSNDELVNEAFRAFHTIKGMSSFLDLKAIRQLAHHAENLLSRVRDGELRLSGDYADLVLRSCDLLRIMVDQVRDAQPGVDLLPSEELPRLLTDLEVAVTQSQAPAQAGDPGQPIAALASSAPTSTTAKQPSNVPEATVRVSTDRLDSLINIVGELVVAQSMLRQRSCADRDEDPPREVAHIGKITRELQDLSMVLRMVPLRPAFEKLRRILRDVARKSGKDINLVITGEDTEIDRTMAEGITDPLVHMMRNAADHGIETADIRIAAGKEPRGTVSLRASHAGGHVVIEVEDDGAGLDRERILAKAKERKLISSEHGMSEAQVLELIFSPGFSTAATVTDVSGRGVGMDVVKTGIERLRGRVSVNSRRGHGTLFSIHLPLTMAITDVMAVACGDETFLVPIVSVRQSLRSLPGDIVLMADRGEMLDYRGTLIPILRLHQAFGIADAIDDLAAAHMIVIEVQGRECAVMVDRLIGQEMVVVKSLGDCFQGLLGISGATILGDGSASIILDPPGLMRLAEGAQPALRRLDRAEGSVDTSIATACVAQLAGKHLSFQLGETLYGLEILRIREIIRLTQITRIPYSTGIDRGIMNLRGKIVPILDLRRVFGMAAIEDSDETRIVVVEHDGQETGIVMDRVDEVLDIGTESIDVSPPAQHAVPPEFVCGVARTSGCVAVLIDIERILHAWTASVGRGRRENKAADQQVQVAHSGPEGE